LLRQGQPAEHWLIADAVTGDLYAAPRREALEIVRRQALDTREGEKS
jgi:hypothetical protein